MWYCTGYFRVLNCSKMIKVDILLLKCACGGSYRKSIYTVSSRGLRYKNNGGLIGGRAKRLPYNWRDLNFNPARIPSAWKPKDWDEKNQIDYERECELAKYIPGYKAKVPSHLQEDFHTEPLYLIDKDSKLVEGLKQAMYLTKSIVANKGLPARINELAKSVSYSDQDDKVIQVFRHAHLFDIDPNVIPKDRRFKYKRYKQDHFDIFPPSERYCPLIMRELVRLCDMRSFQMSTRFENRMLVENVNSTACFKRECTAIANDPTSILNWKDQWKICVEASSDMQMQSSMPMERFADAGAVQETAKIPLSSIYPTLPIVDIKKTNNYSFATQTGIPNKFGKPYLHTMVLFNTVQEPPNLVYSKMLMQLYASLYSRAVEMYGEEPQDLEEPLTGQCVASDGRIFQFMCLQLNTTKMNDDQGIKNMIWVENEELKNELYNIDDAMTPLVMYSECSHATWKSPTYYTDYNPEVFKLFQGFWINGAV